LTAAEKAAYRELARAAAKLRRTQEAAERKRSKPQTTAELLEAEQNKLQRAGLGVANDNA
jgi:hypothetical protein